MEPTAPYVELNLEVTGYMLNASLDVKNQHVIKELQQKLQDRFGESVYLLPLESLHITLMDWVAPLVDYKQDKDALFKTLFDEYDKVLTDVLSNIGEINIYFGTLMVSSGAIFLTGQDDGQFQAIRESFINRINLAPGTKQPPQIIHTTIARFTKATNIAPIRRFASEQSVGFTQQVKEFRLVNEKKVPMLHYDLVKRYDLSI